MNSSETRNQEESNKMEQNLNEIEKLGFGLNEDKNERKC